MSRASVLGSAALCLSAMGWTGAAHAELCSARPNPLFVSGSTAVVPLIAKVAPKFAAATGAAQITVISVAKGTTAGSCSGVIALDKDVTPTGACSVTSCATGVGVANYWDATGTSVPCDLAPEGNHLDLILSDVYKESCDGLTNAKLTDRPLLVIPFGLIAPKASTTEAIDTREAHFVFSKGMAANITPWTNDAAIFYRSSGSGTQITVYKNIQIPTNSSVGVTMTQSATGTGDMITKVGTAANPDQAIGFASLDVADTKRDMVKVLAYRHWGQSKFYWADSTTTSFDKKNVRDGHYPLWSYEHAVSLSDGPNAARAKTFSDALAGTAALPEGDVRQLEASLGLVPLCAMEVSRTIDAGDFSLATTGESCSCFFEKNVTSGTTACKTCAADTDCSSGQKCRAQLCEAR